MIGTNEVQCCRMHTRMRARDWICTSCLWHYMREKSRAHAIQNHSRDQESLERGGIALQDEEECAIHILSRVLNITDERRGR
jgi:hypothetical protein